MDDRRSELRRLLHRRRRVRLLAVCVGAAVVCGVVAAVLAPKVMVGGVAAPSGAGDRSADARRHDAAAPRAHTVLLGLSDRLGLDPREVRHNALRWQTLGPADREVFFQRYWRLGDLEPAEGDRLIAQYEALRRLPEDRQAQLRRQARDLRDFLANLSPQDQAVLAGAPEEERAAKILELLERSRGQ